MKQRFSVTGMFCSACSARVQKGVSSLDGVNSVEVNLISNSMTVDYDAQKQSFDSICHTVKALGYGAGEYVYKNSMDEEGQKHLKRTFYKMMASFVFLFVLMFFSMQHMFGYRLPKLFDDPVIMGLTQLLLTVPIIVLNFHYFKNGFKNLFKLSPNMDSLIALGSSASFLYSLYILICLITNRFFEMGINFHADHLYFESAAMILTLITLGKYLEARGKRKTGSAIENLIKLTPKSATLLLDDGTEESVSITNIKENDLLVAKPGDTVAVDGIVVSGSSSVDMSAITGENMPVEVTHGSSVTGATINLSGKITYKAVKVGEDTTISKIIRLVEEAGASTAPIARVADKISLYFVPTVIAIAILTTLIWFILGKDAAFSLNMGISVLVISCPCALGLATPAAIMAGIGAGAKNGVLVKSAPVLETAHKINAVILDKTGTITEGKPSVCAVYGDVLQLAYSLEKNSTHPLAISVCEYCAEKGISPLEVENFENIAGLGIKGTINNHICVAGNNRYMNECGIDFEDFKEQIAEQGQSGATLLMFAENGKAVGVIGVKDKCKSDSIAAIRSLKSMGKQTIMLTGDNQGAAKAVAKEAGVDHYLCELLPQDKEAYIHKLQTDGYCVAMVGDGINDAPALIRADVGIAIGAGTDIAVEAADIVLSGGSLYGVVTSLRLGDAVIKNIKMSLFWAFFYNCAGIPIAAGALSFLNITLNPMIAAAAMSLSSICVVLNALRLTRFKKK